MTWLVARLKDWRALLLIGGDAFLRILALEAKLLQFALDGQRLGERHLGAGLHRALQAANRACEALFGGQKLFAYSITLSQ